MDRQQPQNSANRNYRARLGFVWTLLTTFGVRGVDLLRIIVVARLLAPEDFGLFGMAMVVLLSLSALGTFGLKEAFIAHRQDSQAEEQRWLHAIWTGNLGVQFLLMCLLLAVAWPAAQMYDEPRLFPMLLVLAVIPALKSLNNPALMVLEKRIEFGKVAVFDLLVAVIALVATTGLAWATRSAWALVLGQVISALAGIAMSYALAPMRPRFRVDWEPVRQSLHFGKYLMAISVMTVITTQVDNLIVGLKLGAAALGFYAIAYRISDIPKLVIGSTVGRTLFPYYSEIVKEDTSRLGSAWVQTFAYVCWLAMAAYIPLLLCPEYLVTLLFGDQWTEAAKLLIALSVLGIIRSFNRALNPLLMALKKTRVDALAKLVETIVFLPSILAGLAITGDALGIAWGSAAAYAVGAVWRLSWGIYMLRPGGREIANRVGRPVFGFVVMLIAGQYLLQMNLHPLLVITAVIALWSVMVLALERLVRQWLFARLPRAAGAMP